MTSEEGWQRLDPRTVAASVIMVAGALLVGIPIALGLLLSGVSAGWTAFWVGGSAAVLLAFVALVEAIRMRATRWRIDEHRIERRMHFLSTSRTSLARERIRNVELSADLVQRRLGLVEVKLAAGDQEGDRFKLQALDRATGEALRTELLGDRHTTQTGTLATINWAWLRYAPVSLLTPLLGLIAYAGVFQVADWFQSVPAMLSWVWDRIGVVPVPALIAIAMVLALIIGTVAMLCIFVEEWWNFRLGRHPDGSLDLRRGLLMSRSTNFQGDRIRGVVLHEPLGLRRLRAARLDIIAVGMSQSREAQGQDRQSPALVPAAPREVPVEIGATILRAPIPEELRAHPPAARLRRLVRAGITALLGAALATIPAFFWPSLWWIAVLTLVVLAVVMIALALDDARGLGHHITPTHVFLRRDALFRRTTALHRDGILGWNLRQGPLQRRLGLATVVATSAGGSGAFTLPDTSADQASELAGTAGPVWDHLRVRTDA